MKRAVDVPPNTEDLTWLRARQIKRAESRLDLLIRVPRNLGALPMKCHRIAASRDLGELAVGAIDDLRLVVESTLLLFSAFRTDAPETLTLRGVHFKRPRASVHGYITTTTLRNALYCAMILRDRAAIEELAQIPMELIRSSPTVADAYAYPMAEALQGMVTDEGGWQDRLTESIVLAQRETYRYTKEIGLPVLRMMEAIYQGEEAFNQALYEALLAPRTYWSRGDKKNAPEGLLALAPAALAAWAWDGMTPITVQSGYAPDWLIEGGFGG